MLRSFRPSTYSSKRAEQYFSAKTTNHLRRTERQCPIPNTQCGFSPVLPSRFNTLSAIHTCYASLNPLPLKPQPISMDIYALNLWDQNTRRNTLNCPSRFPIEQAGEHFGGTLGKPKTRKKQPLFWQHPFQLLSLIGRGILGQPIFGEMKLVSGQGGVF